MNDSLHDAAFLDQKRQELNKLREQLLTTRGAAQNEQAEANAETVGEAREFEDDAQKLVTLELEGSLEARDTERLATIDRALRKIDEGTYGLSAASGEPIPIERLNAVPDAMYTLAEQEAMDRKA
jgi:DnaK suppressor protein